MLGDVEGVVLQGDGGGRLPVFEGGAEVFVEGGDLTMVVVGGTEGDGAITGVGGAKEAGEGEGFFGLVVVEFGGKVGMDLAYLI